MNAADIRTGVPKADGRYVVFIQCAAAQADEGAAGGPYRRQCKYIGHDWSTRLHFIPVFPEFRITPVFEEPSSEPTKIEARATVPCLREGCRAWRIYDYQGNVVEEGQ